MDAKEVVKNAKDESSLANNQIRRVADWFHENEEDVFLRDKAVDRISSEVNVESPTGISTSEFVNKLISGLVGDHVDPVQQIPTSDGRHVGVISYSEFDGYYTFTEYHDISGEYDRGVCAQCVAEAEKSSEPFTRHTGEFGNQPYGDMIALRNIIENHIEEEHDEEVEVETGATLASGTTIAGNTSIHEGNQTFTMSGTLNLNGSPALDIGQANALLISTTIASSETLTIETGEGMIQSGPITLDGTLESNGSYTTTGSISGTGSITGTGSVEVI